MDNTLNIQEKEKSFNKKIILCLFILLLLIIAILVILGENYFADSKEAPTENKELVTLQYTNTEVETTEGVYMIDVSEVVENVMPSIVAITSKTLISSGRFGPNYYGQNQYTEGAGSGIIISKSDEELFIVTNNHVVEGASELTVQFINNKSVDATIKGTSKSKDIAVISVKLNELDEETIKEIKIATIGNSDEIKVGNGVIAIGNALGYGQSVTTGVISALEREVTIDNYTNSMIQIDAAINGGNSGGALLNSKGEVIGINSAKYSSNGTISSASIEGMGFAIPISDVEDLITDIINGEEIEEGVTLGIEGYIITNENINGYFIENGFYITKVVSESNASKAGLEAGYIITEINGQEVNTFSDLSNVISEKKKGGTSFNLIYMDPLLYQDRFRIRRMLKQRRDEHSLPSSVHRN